MTTKSDWTLSLRVKSGKLLTIDTNVAGKHKFGYNKVNNAYNQIQIEFKFRYFLSKIMR